jgi:hypothetical protein
MLAFHGADYRSLDRTLLLFCPNGGNFSSTGTSRSILRDRIEGAIDLGVGNRSIVSGGRLDPKYRITVPANL